LQILLIINYQVGCLANHAATCSFMLLNQLGNGYYGCYF
jgi:hypothetical protein